MGKNPTKLFIESIPADKLKGLPRRANTKIFSDVNFRLDMQKMTNEDKHVLLVQINTGATLSKLKRAKGNNRNCPTDSVIIPSAPNELDPEEVRKQLIEAVLF